MKRLLICLSLLLLVPFAMAEDSAPPMTKIVYRKMSPRIPENSFGEKPVTLYIAGTTYSRVEEVPDPEQGIHGLVVIHEPDLWMVNFLAGEAKHMVDPGPTFVVHNNIMPRDAGKAFEDFEFGQEVKFFRSRSAKTLAPQTLEGTPCEVLEYRHAEYRLVLYVRKDSGTPFQIDLTKDGEGSYSIRYLSFQTGLPFDAALFRPPAGIPIKEVKPGRLSN